MGITTKAKAAMQVMRLVFGRGKARGEGTAFSFKQLENVDEETVRAYFANTNAKTRRLPLLVAGQVYAEIEDAMTTPGRKDALHLAEMRGGMMALRRFAIIFSEGVRDELQRT